jgi:hypothetical protein
MDNGMKWEEFNDLLWQAYPWDGEKYDYELKCPAITISFDNGGWCRQCHKFTVDVMEGPPYKANNLFVITYRLLGSKPRMCSRECLFNYINAHYAEILEEITR